MFDETVTPETPDLFEGMTAISAVLDESIRDFNDRRVLSVFVDKTRMDKKAREIAFLQRRADLLVVCDAIQSEERGHFAGRARLFAGKRRTEHFARVQVGRLSGLVHNVPHLLQRRA